MLILNRLNRLDRLRDSLWSTFDNLNSVDNAYPYYEETDEGYELQLNLAGVKKENINVYFEGDLLKVRAEQDDREYSQDFSTPKKADKSASVAKYEDGILYLKINKLAEAKPVEVKIN